MLKLMGLNHKQELKLEETNSVLVNKRHWDDLRYQEDTILDQRTARPTEFEDFIRPVKVRKVETENFEANVIDLTDDSTDVQGWSKTVDSENKDFTKYIQDHIIDLTGEDSLETCSVNHVTERINTFHEVKDTLEDMADGEDDVRESVEGLKDLVVTDGEDEVDSITNAAPTDVRTVHGYQKMPYLSDTDSIEFIQKSHTMFIMRGLPGSGKSTLVKVLQQIYPGAVVCSADHFFLDKEGNYRYNKAKLTDAHKTCQEKATLHCEQGTRVIIIDNTNIQRWTMGHYLKLAQNSHFYHPIIVKPQTPWRFDVKELADRNSHGVEEEIIKQKLQSLKDNVFVPTYYGWFLTRTDSSTLGTMSREIVKSCLNTLSGEMLNAFKEIHESLDSKYTSPKPMLHCTANYLARRNKDAYHACKPVIEALGKRFILTVSGFVFSPRAICARVDLYAQSDKGDKTCRTTFPDAELGRIKEKLDKRSVEQRLNLYVKEEEERLRDKYEQVPGVLIDEGALRHGCSAHITIAYAQSGQAKHSGDELLSICEQDFCGRVLKERTSVGTVCSYEGNIYQVSLDQPVSYDCLFHGFYTGYR